MDEQLDVAQQWARLKDDVIRFSGHVMPAKRASIPGAPSAAVAGRVRYREGSDGPVIWIDSDLSQTEQLWVLQAAWQIMVKGVPESARRREPDGYWFVDIGWSD